MKLTLSETSLLKDSIGIISELVSEARFIASQESFSLIALDPATVAMVDFKLLASAFTEYTVDKTEILAINLMNLKQVLRRVGSTDTITLETKEDRLEVTIKGSVTRTFNLPLIELDGEQKSVPDIKFSTTVTLFSQQLSNAIDDAHIVAESIALVAQEKLLSVRAEGDLSKVTIDIPQDNDTKIVIQDGEETPVIARYSIEYLKKMVSAGKIADKVTLHYKTNHPIKLEYRVLNKIHLGFILAPRVDND